MSIWILIWYIGTGAGVTSGSVEFTNQLACNQARAELISTVSAMRTVSAICVRKS